MVAAYAGRLASQGLYFIVLARLLKADGFGVFAAVFALVSIPAPFAGWGSANLLVMRTARDKRVFSREFGRGLLTLAGTGTILLGITLTVSSVMMGHGASLQLVAILATAELFSSRLVDLGAAAFQAHDRLDMTARVITIDSGLRLVAVVAFGLTATTYSAQLWAWWYLGASIAAAAITIAIVVQQFGGPQLERGKGRLSLREGFFFSLGTASKSVYSDIDKVMLERLASAGATGIYAAAYRLLTIAFAPIQALVFSSNTKLFRDGEKGAAHVLAFAVRAFPAVFLYGAAAGIALYAASPLIPVLLGTSFGPSVQALRWLSLMPLIQGTHYLFGDALMGAGKQAIRSGFQLGTAGVNIILNLALIPMWSWRGAAIASLISEFLLAVALVGTLYVTARYGTSSRSTIEPEADKGPPAIVEASSK